MSIYINELLARLTHESKQKPLIITLESQRLKNTPFCLIKPINKNAT
jgi:hypothetical protein